MEIKLKSKFFKRIFDRENILAEHLQNTEIICIWEDPNVPLIKPLEYKKILDDYATILKYVNSDCEISFDGLSDRLVRDLLKIGFPSKTMKIVNSDFDFSILDNIDSSTFEHIEELYLEDIQNKSGVKRKFKHASSLKKLKKLDLRKCEGLEVDALLADIPFPENLQKLCISNDVPTLEQMERYRNITELSIQGIDNPQKLFNFLESIQLENLTLISLRDCNLENMPETLISRLTSLTILELKNNRNTDYDNILSNLPNKSLIEEMWLTATEEKSDEIDIRNLEEYSQLRILKLTNFNIDFDALALYLETASDLESIDLYNANVENLDFLAKAQLNIKINIQQNDIDFKMLTPEIAKKHKDIFLSRQDKTEYIETIMYEQEGMEPVLNLLFKIKNENLGEIQDLVSDVDVIARADITVTDNCANIEDILLRHSDKLESGYSITAPSFAVIDEEMCSKLNKDGKLNNICVIDPEADEKDIESRFKYTPEQYNLLKKKVREITEDIPNDLTELQKFMIIYRRLGVSIAYDHGIIGKNKYSKYAKDNFDDSRNCVNGLLKRTCVCAGYTDILYNCLREVGIESYKITGIGVKEYHQWNKVKLDGVFYNTDLTWDASFLSRNIIDSPWNCLRGDKIFGKFHKQLKGKEVECPQNYNVFEIAQALEFAMKFDNVKIKNPNMLKLIKSLGHVVKFVEQIKINGLDESVKQTIKKFSKILKFKEYKSPELLPPPSEGINKGDAGSNLNLENTGTSSKKPSWELGKDAPQVKAKVEEVVRRPILDKGIGNHLEERGEE